MSTVDEIKSVAAKLSLEDKIELHRWLFDLEEMRRWQSEQLRNEIGIGLADEARGDIAPLDMNAIKIKARETWEARGR